MNNQALDDWIMGINDPHAPFNQPDINEEDIEEEIKRTYDTADAIIKALKLTNGDLEEFAHEYADRPYFILKEDPMLYDYLRSYYFVKLALKLGYKMT